MNKEIFLIDTNSLITPYEQYYPFDIAPKFWDQIEESIKNGEIAILNLVKEEILKGNNDDDLKKWFREIVENDNIKRFIRNSEELVFSKYTEIMEFVEHDHSYKPSATKEWASETSADPWLIAAAAVYNLTLITLEVSNSGLSKGGPRRKAKIPDVAKEFNVKTENLFYMMRQLDIKL